MKLMSYFTIGLALAVYSASAFATSLVRLEHDQPNYSVGTKAVIFAYLDHAPENANDEFHVEYSSQADAINFIKISDQLAIAFTPNFKIPGFVEANANIYQQKKLETLNLNSSIAFYTLEVRGLREKLNYETDPEAREEIQAQIQRANQMIAKLNDQLEDFRSLVEIKHIDFLVEPSTQLKLNQKIFTINKDQENYSVGQKAIFTAHLNTQFSGPQGPVENIFLANIDGGQNIIAKRLSADDYSFTSGFFQAGEIGSHIFNATLFIRPKKQADLLRQALALTNRKKGQFQKELSESGNPAYRAYLQLKIEDLQLATTAINTQLSDALLEVASEQINFDVVN